MQRTCAGDVGYGKFNDSINVPDRIFGFSTPAQREFNSVFRKVVFELAIKHNVDLEIRLKRNLTPHRMERKASKKDTKWSEENLLRDTQRHKLNTARDETFFENHLKIDNTNLKMILICCRKWQIERFDIIW